MDMEYRIKEIAKEKVISIGALAEKIGIQRETLSRIVNGGNTSTGTLQDIANALSVSLTDLFDQPTNDVINCPYCGGKIKVGKE